MDIIAPQGKITLVSVIEVPAEYDYALADIPLTVVSSRAYDQTAYDETARRVKEYLQGQGKPLKARGFEIECVVESGDPATAIAEVATARNANAIVMTTHGRTGFSRWLFGSVTQKVISLRVCPVMVVPGTQPERKQVPISQEATATS